MNLSQKFRKRSTTQLNQVNISLKQLPNFDLLILHHFYHPKLCDTVVNLLPPVREVVCLNPTKLPKSSRHCSLF